MLSWSVTVLLGPLVGEIAIEFGLESEAKVGNITATFLLVGGVIAFLWVAVEDRLSRQIEASRKYLLIFATLIWAIGLFLTSWAQNYEQLFRYQMITAVGYAAITPIAFSIAMDLTPPEGRAKAFGLLDVAAMIGVGVGFLLSGILIELVPWNVPFVVIGTFGLILLGITINLQDPKRGQQERELQEIFSVGSEYNYHISRRGIVSIIKNKTNLFILLFNIILYLASGSISYYFIRMMVNDHAFTSMTAVLFFLITYGSQAIGAVFWTKRADEKFVRRASGKVRVLLESLLIGPGFLIIAYALVFSVTNGMMIGIFVLLLTIGAFLVSGLIAISFSILSDVNPPEMRSTIFSMNNLSQTLGRGAGIFLMGALFILSGGRYQWGFALMGGVYFLAIVFAIPLLRSVPIEIGRMSVLLSERAKKLRGRIDVKYIQAPFDQRPVR